MKRLHAFAPAFFLAVVASSSVHAQVTLYGNSSPTGNRGAFTSALGGLTTLTFDDQATGTLNGSFYPGVTLIANANVNQIVFGAGPGQGNTFSTPLSVGEGVHEASNYLAGSGSQSLIVNFDNAVFGAGLSVIDLFNPASCNCSGPLFFSAYSGTSGTGALIGSLTGVQYNFQNNGTYFVGISSAAGDIRSVVYSYNGSGSGDTTGLDDITYATSSSTETTPEPASLALVVPGLLAIGAVRRRSARR